MIPLSLEQGIFAPDDLAVIQSVYNRVASEPWFSKGAVYRSRFASEVLDRYRSGSFEHQRFYELCRAAAWQRYRQVRSAIEGYRFLVVEDDYLIASDAVSSLENLGASVLGPFASVSEAIHAVELGAEIDGALLDVNLNGEMSYPVAALLKMRQVPFAFISGYDDRILPAFFRASLICSKPTDWAVLATLLVRRSKAADKASIENVNLAS
jgi:CheY-like chemotaxis protein